MNTVYQRRVRPTPIATHLARFVEALMFWALGGSFWWIAGKIPAFLVLVIKTSHSILDGMPIALAGFGFILVGFLCLYQGLKALGGSR